MSDQEQQSTPTLYEWVGGAPALETLMAAFYRRVRQDDVLAPLFANMPEDHPHHVAMWFGEVFGGPATYTEQRGGFRVMRAQHVGKDIAPEQRQRWVSLMLEAADEVGLPDDAEFRSAFAAYVEWGSRRAMANSRPGVTLSPRTTTPVWGWGEAPPGID
ncbi:group II truncated hemoglobin [Natronosporangium hydrolyticum]|uniref:Group II truncated hemoglobin n=1 Tax=Natronosporangium hydrolyticum TaxID=2811111 RepID=A0A895Y8E0_9ACTN|nr:group II truncated hemoglobin [Natronosporangium hydrolyticum]QSB13977.1 group II truncated hemoglobin [Natronosporangium hydrolyticum]